MSERKDGGAAVEVGAWVCIQGTYGYDTGEVKRTTDQFVWRTDDFFNKRLHRANRSMVIFCGAQDECRKLKQQCESSRAQGTQDAQAAYQRHAKRVAGFVDALLSARVKP